MNDKQLRAFVSVAESKSFSKAESRLFLTRQAVQKQIQSLEAELGESLFMTSRSGTYLTPFGEFIYPRAKKMLQGYDELVNQCALFIRDKLCLRIGNALEQIPLFLPSILDDFQKEYPAAEIEMRYVEYDDKTVLLDNNTFDVILDYVEKTWQSDSYEYFALYETNYSCYVNENSELADHDFIRLEDLANRAVTFWYPGHKRIDTLLSDARLNVQINNVEKDNVINLLAASRKNEVYISRYDSFQSGLPVKRIPFDDRYKLTVALIFHIPATLQVKSFLDIATDCLTKSNIAPDFVSLSSKNRLGHSVTL